MSYLVVAKQKYQQKDTKIIKTLSAGGPTRAAAMLLLSAKASAVVGFKIGRPTVSSDEPITAGRTPVVIAGPFEDAVLFIQRVVGGNIVDTSKIEIKNVSTLYADPNLAGKILWNDPNMQLIASTHYDSNGNTGWVAYDGVFAEAPSR